MSRRSLPRIETVYLKGKNKARLSGSVLVSEGLFGHGGDQVFACALRELESRQEKLLAIRCAHLAELFGA